MTSLQQQWLKEQIEESIDDPDPRLLLRNMIAEFDLTLTKEQKEKLFDEIADEVYK